MACARALLSRTNVFSHLSRSCSTVSGAKLQTKEAPSLSYPQKDLTLLHPDFFGVSKMFTVKDLLDARVHLGHKEGTLDDRMRPYLFGSRLGHLIFDLDITAKHLERALNFLGHVTYRSGIILFISRHRQTSYLVDKTAKECGEYSHTRSWNHHIFTDSSRVFGTLTRLPDLLVILHTMDSMEQEHGAIRDAAKMCIPTIAVVDSNCNPNLITYPIPGNDDTPEAISLYLNLFSKVVLKAKQMQDNKPHQ